MVKLNLGFDNPRLYRRCKVTPVGQGRYRLDTPLDSAVVLVASELFKILEDIPENERDLLVLTGGAPPAIYMTAQAVLGAHFDRVEHFDGNKRIGVTIPQPPEHFQGGLE